MKRILLIGAMLYGGLCSAQDPHFSQYYASQMTVNPATAGMFQGDMRLSGLYRQQWPQFGSPFVTGTFAFEWKPQGFKDGQNINRLALGGLMMYDKTPDEVLKGQYLYGTIAYHKALDENGDNNDKNKAYEITYSLRYHSANELIGRYFFVPGQNGALHHFAQAGNQQVEKISQYGGEKGIQSRRAVPKRADKNFPPQCPDVMTDHQQCHCRQNQPVVGIFQCVCKVLPVFGRQVVCT